MTDDHPRITLAYHGSMESTYSVLFHKLSLNTGRMYVCMVTHIARVWDQPGKIANPGLLVVIWSVFCVFLFPFILDVRFVWVYQPESHRWKVIYRISHPRSFCDACLYFSREKDSAVPFPRRSWSRILCTNDLIVLHLLGIFILFYFLVRKKIPVIGNRTHVPMCQKVTRLPTELPGRPALEKRIFLCPRSRLRIWSRETGSAVPSRVSLLISMVRLDRVLTYGIPPEFHAGVHLFIGNRHTPSGQSRVYRVTQLRTDGVHCRESADTGPVNLKVVPNEWSADLAGHHGPINMRLSFPHPLLLV